ncbi:MAG: Rqc2 family fibronectin-binding protein [Bacillota bacterium]|jgi:predicted ribosome quality control (RQC) complex YloA/Tae2 family protein
MPFDGFVMAAVTSELQDKIILGRLVKISQPERHLVIFRIKKAQNYFNLLFSAHPTTGRIHLTSTARENPLKPPLFCMVLRKHLEGGRITGINQKGLERILEIKVEAHNELGEQCDKTLIIEIMGKHSNILLIDPLSNNILDGIRRYNHSVSRYREVLPGKPYLPAPSQNKADPLFTDEEEFRSLILSLPLTTKISKAIVQNFSGFSPLLAREIVFRSGLFEDAMIDNLGDYELIRLWQAFQDLKETVKTANYQATVIKHGWELNDFLPVQTVQYTKEETEEFSSISEALDYFYQTKELQNLFSSRQRELTKIIKNETVRVEKKLSLQSMKLLEAEDAEKFKFFGELITANLHRLSQGIEKATLDDFYRPGQTVEVLFDPTLTPIGNAQLYFKKYNKAKSSKTLIQEQIDKGREELNYLESVLSSIEHSESLKDLDEIRAELVDSGYLKEKSPQRRGKPEKDSPQPLSFTSKDGYSILVGKNNKQNDLLTQRIAHKNDLWLHAKNIPGSHVIIRKKPGTEIPFSTIEEAAKLAAFFSKARNSSQVPVDYTIVRQVKKPHGAKPGMVIYFEQKTLYVTPETPNKSEK